MFWTIWFWLGLFAGWIVTVGYCIDSWVSGLSWLPGLSFTVIVFWIAPTFPTATCISLLTLYVIGIFVVATHFPFSILLLIYLSFLIPFLMVLLGRTPFGTRVELFDHKKKKEKNKKKEKKKQKAKGKEKEPQQDSPDPRAQDIINYVHSLRDQFTNIHNQPFEIISANKMFAICDLFIKSLSKEQLDQFIKECDGNIEASACRAVILTVSEEANSLKDGNGKIRTEELPIELLKHLNVIVEMMNFTVKKSIEAEEDYDPTEEVDLENYEDEFSC